MMSNHSRNAMLARRPDQRPLIITRSTFLGAGSYVAHWLGDNISDWPHYRISIAQMLAFNSIFQIPVVGSDIAGFGGNTTETLTARWMMLGSFYTFMRNHAEVGTISQEAYRWESVAEASRRAINIRYRMLDYIYTALYEQTVTGTPSINSMFYLYPTDPNTFGIDLQFFFGSSVLISPVTEENSTSVDIYLPNDIFYDWNNGLAPVQGDGKTVTLDDVDFQTIPIHIKGGSIIPLRAQGANTTTELRKQDFEILVAPGLNGTASGALYVDDGVSLTQQGVTYVSFVFDANTLSMTGSYEYNVGVNISRIIVLGMSAAPQSVAWNGNELAVTYNASSQVVTVQTAIPITADVTVSFGQLQAYTGIASSSIAVPSTSLAITAISALWLAIGQFI